MTASGSTNIPSRCPRREDLRGRPVDTLVDGRGGKADVFAVHLPQGPAVVKDFSRRSFWGRLAGRAQIAREAKAYAWLAGVPGIPGFLGRIDPWALALEKLDAKRLAFVELPPAQGERYVAKLRIVLDALHARGVVHNDLRGRENVLLRSDGELAVVDFAGALRLRPGGLAHRLFFRLLRTTDEAAFLKWKGLLAPGTYTEEDKAFLERFERWRLFWPFNPKRRRPPAEAA